MIQATAWPVVYMDQVGFGCDFRPLAHDSYTWALWRVFRRFAGLSGALP